MSFDEILAGMGETGELGENPHGSLRSGRAKEGRIRPGMGDTGEKFAQIRPAFALSDSAPDKGNRSNRPFRPAEAEKLRQSEREAHDLINRLCIAWSCQPGEFEELLAMHRKGKLTLDYIERLIQDAPPNLIRNRDQ